MSRMLRVKNGVSCVIRYGYLGQWTVPIVYFVMITR